MKKRQSAIDRLDPRYTPISAWGYVGYKILFAIPVLGWLLLIIFACSKSNLNRRAFARSYFCILLLAVIFGGLVVLVLWLAGAFDVIEGLWAEIVKYVSSIFA